MVLAVFAIFGLTEAALYAGHRNSHCYTGHGGTPVDAEDTVINNITTEECEAVCDKTENCVAVSTYGQGGGGHRRRKRTADCYLRAQIDLDQCELDNENWTTYTQIEPPATSGLLTYHLFEPKYTGLDNRDAGDFVGDASFIFSCFSNYSKGNPEASMDHNVIEMSEVNVTGWGTYEQCNAPGADGHFVCPSNQTDYCCTVHGPNGENIPTNHTSTQLPGLEISPRDFKGGSGGFWFSFPMESKDVTWTEKPLRRIAGKCLGNAWRKDAGGCGHCGEALDECVANCIQDMLVVDNNLTLLEATWDRVFADPDECPEIPRPDSVVVV